MSRDEVPLVVDLDETLVPLDTLRLLRQRLALHRPWLMRRQREQRAKGKQHEKIWLWRTVPLDVARLPLNEPLLDRVRSCAGRRPLILATGSSGELAAAVSARLGCFDAVVGTDDTVNLTGPRKGARLLELYGPHGFDYIGDSPADVEVWMHARRAFVCSASAHVLALARGACTDTQAVDPARTTRGQRARLLTAGIAR